MNYQTVARDISIKSQRSKDRQQSNDFFVASNYLAKGRFLTVGVGEVFKDIKFPVTFIEQPSFIAGGVLEQNQQLQIGFAPTFSAVVISWVTETQGQQTILYKGARLCVVISGNPETIKMWVNWHVIGDAIVNPIDSSLIVNGTI